MICRSVFAFVCLALAATLPAHGTTSTQDRAGEQPTSQRESEQHAEGVAPAPSEPSSQPVPPKDPLRSPATMVDEFLRAVTESKKTPQRMKDAVQCLDLTSVKEPEKQGPLLAEQLGQIINALLNTYGTSLDEIPDEPDGTTVSFPAEGDVQLVLMRSDAGQWRFSAATVAAIPAALETVRQRQTPKTDVAENVPPRFRSARATMRTFLEAMAEGDSAAATDCLDLSEQAAATRAEIGSDLADRLLFVMDRIEVVVYHRIPDKPDGEPYAWYIDEHGRIELARQEAGKRKGWWLFTTVTVGSIESLYKAFEDKPRLEALKGPSFSTSPQRWLLEKIPLRWKADVFSVQLWQWLGVTILLVLGYVAYRAAFLVLCAVARTLGRSEHVELSGAHLTSSMRPLSMLVMVATWWGGLQLLLIPASILTYVWPALKFVMTGVCVWASYRLIDLLAGYFADRAKLTPSRLDDVLVPLVRKMAKILVVAIGGVYILKAVGAEKDTINKLFAGMGLGGLAFALAAQDSLRNFFGSITVVFDRPFHVGDWVKIGDAEGTVESVGLRSSRIRTFYNSEITVPNSEVMTAVVDNMGRRRYRRINCKLSVTYSTLPEQLEAFCEGVRELIRRHPYTRKDYYHVWVNQFADSAINVLLYCFLETPDWSTELRERHRLFVDIVRVAQRLGVEFAFPTQTVHLHHESSPPEPPRPGSSVPDDPDKAIAFGRQEAAAVVRKTLGEDPVKPPPVTF